MRHTGKTVTVSADFAKCSNSTDSTIFLIRTFYLFTTKVPVLRSPLFENEWIM